MSDVDLERLKADSERRRIMMDKGIEFLDGLSKNGENFPVNELAKIMIMRLNDINNMFVGLVANEGKLIGLIGGLVNMTSELTKVIGERIAPALVEVKKTKELQDELKEKYDSTLGSLNEVSKIPIISKSREGKVAFMDNYLLKMQLLGEIQEAAQVKDLNVELMEHLDYTTRWIIDYCNKCVHVLTNYRPLFEDLSDWSREFMIVDHPEINTHLKHPMIQQNINL